MAETKKQAVGWRESIGELTEYYLKNSKDEKKVKKINKRINKKATIITWFIIICLVLLIGIILYTYMTQVSIKPLKLKTDELKIVKEYTEICLGNVLDNSLFIAAKQGGYIWPETTIETPFGNTSIGAAKKETSEMQISKYITNKLPSCLNNYSFFQEKGLVIKQGLLVLKTIIGENNINAIVTMPVKIVDNSSNVQVVQFTKEKEIRLGKLIQYAKEVLEYDDVGLSYLSTLDVNTTIIKQDNNIVYVFEDENSLVKDAKYLFMFAKEVE
ncbi:hypothetical protein J4434_01285 [Candidatus Woesearchaeota archaeon]|nr:hypothetical protein [Candidatus Woesearchaeota archaeon]